MFQPHACTASALHVVVQKALRFVLKEPVEDSCLKLRTLTCEPLLLQAAIFGKSSSTAPPQLTPRLDSLLGMKGGLGLGASAAISTLEAGEVDNDFHGTEACNPCTLAAESVVITQPGLSWREHAALKRKQLAGQ